MLEFLENHMIESVLVAVAPGLYAIWRAFVAAAVRRIEHAYREVPAGTSDDARKSAVTDTVARSMPYMPRGVIRTAVEKHSERPPK